MSRGSREFRRSRTFLPNPFGNAKIPFDAREPVASKNGN